jgi:hypothetical protein
VSARTVPLEIRIYAGLAGQAGRLSAVRQELEALLKSMTGLRRLLVLETAEGLAMVTEAEDRATCEECARRAEHWMRERIPSLAGYQPLTTMGEVIAEWNVATPDRIASQ